MELRTNGWLVLNVYVVRDIVNGRIPVYNLPLQSEESEGVTEDFPFRVTDRAKNKILGVKDTISGVVDLGNGQQKALLLHRPTGGAEGLEEILSYSISEMTVDADDPSSEVNMGKEN